MRHPIRTPFLACGCAAALFLTSACSGGGGSGGGTAVSFLGIEARVDRDGPGMSDGNEPQILAVGSTLYAVWEDDRSGNLQVYFNTSTDGGRTWLANDVLVPGSAAAGTDIEHPRIACDGATVFVLFEEDQAVGDEDIYVNRSTDGGLTWQAQGTRLDTGAVGAADSERPAILVEGTTVFVAWGDRLSGEDDIYFTRSVDDGLTWSAPVRLDTDALGAADSMHVQLCASGDDVYAVWEDWRNGQRDIYFNRSADGGVTWLPADVRLDMDAPGAADSAWQKLACQGQTVHVLWVDDRAGNLDVYYRRSADAGATWGPEVVLGSSPGGVNDEDPDLEALGSLVTVAWKAKSPGPSDDLFVTVSSDGGATWLPAPIRLDTDAPGAGDSDDVHLCIEGQTVYATWEDDRNGLDDIYLSYSTDGGMTWSNPDLFAEGGAKGASDASSPEITCSSEGVWIIWEDDRNGDIDIMVNGGRP